MMLEAYYMIMAPSHTSQRTTWFSADHHLGHLRIPALTQRPFPATPEGVRLMNAEIIRRHNDVVSTEDLTWFLGDFALGKISETLTLAAEFNGTKHLVSGNHDRCFPGYSHRHETTYQEWVPKYEDAGFRQVFHIVPFAVTKINGNRIRLSHFPYKGGGDSRSGPERHPEYRLDDTGQWLLCGHVHGAWRQRGRMINVGVDAWGGYPVSETQIAALIDAGPNDLDPLPWPVIGRCWWCGRHAEIDPAQPESNGLVKDSDTSWICSEGEHCTRTF